MNSYSPPASETAAAAAAWVRAAYPDIEVESGDQILLHSPQHSEAELRLVWKAACFNERAAAFRSGGGDAVLELLLA